jgi:hypothetical protein
MPKKYEDEIRDILKGMDRFPGEGDGGTRQARARRPSVPRFGGGAGGGLSTLTSNPQKLMGGALILILFAWIMQGPWTYSPTVLRMAGYVSLAGMVLFIIGLILMLRSRGGFNPYGGGFGAPVEKRWRGQVINFPNRQPAWRRWWLNLTRRFNRSSNGPRRSGSRGRDSIQW